MDAAMLILAFLVSQVCSIWPCQQASSNYQVKYEMAELLSVSGFSCLLSLTVVK